MTLRGVIYTSRDGRFYGWSKLDNRDDFDNKDWKLLVEKLIKHNFDWEFVDDEYINYSTLTKYYFKNNERPVEDLAYYILGLESQPEEVEVVEEE